MSETAAASSVILKILSGVQAGVEVSLVPGEYGIGSGVEDDIQLIDVSLKPGHARLRLSPGKIEVAGAKGALRTGLGVNLDAGSDWQEIEPLDVVTLGTIRLALGAPNANWASIADGADIVDAAGAGRSRASRAGSEGGSWRFGGRLAVPLTAMVLLLGFATWQVAGGVLAPHVLRFSNRDDLGLTRQALDAFPFGRTVQARQDVDGTVFVTGHVETPVERRALAGAIERTGVPARVRLSVLQTIRSEVANLVASQKVNVTPTVTPDGELELDGVILGDAAAGRFVDLVQDRVVGVSRLTNRIRTAKSLLAEIEKVAQTSALQPYVILRVDNELIEANGAVPVEKIDAWVGFLQSYARRFSKDIALRSFVQLQNAAGRPAEPGAPIMLGGESGLDIERLKRGTFRLSDVFSGESPSGAQFSVPGMAAMRGGIVVADASGNFVGNVGQGSDGDVDGRARSVEDTAQAARPAFEPSSAPRAFGAGPGAGAAGAGSSNAAAAPGGNAAMAAARASQDESNPGPAEGRSGSDELAQSGRQVLERWREGNAGRDKDALVLRRAMQALTSANGGGQPNEVPDWYVPLLSSSASPEASRQCWTNAKLTADDIVGTLFWLDLLSASDTMSITTLGRSAQGLLLEAALNPGRVEACAKRLPAAEKTAANSLYLREIARNASFVRFITRDMAPFKLDVAGASLAQERFILTRGGRKMFEGAAPDRGSRLALVGELGVAIQAKTGYSAVVFGPEMNWKILQ